MEDKNEYEICPASGKVCYSSQEAQRVVNIAHRRRRSRIKRYGKRIPDRIYKCPHCGYFHTTSSRSPVIHRGWKPKK